MNDAATQRLFRSWGVPLVRVPMRRNLADVTLATALTAMREIGAVPVVIVSGLGELAGDDAILARDLHDLELVHRVVGDRSAYLEYGNEDDLGHGITAAHYTVSWNVVVARLEAAAPPSYRFVGPVTYQMSPTRWVPAVALSWTPGSVTDVESSVACRGKPGSTSLRVSGSVVRSGEQGCRRGGRRESRYRPDVHHLGRLPSGAKGGFPGE
jgi:hypothetical protein